MREEIKNAIYLLGLGLGLGFTIIVYAHSTFASKSEAASNDRVNGIEKRMEDRDETLSLWLTRVEGKLDKAITDQ